MDDEITAISTNLDENLKIRERKQSLYSLQHAYKSLKKLSSILSMETFMENPTKIDVLEQAAIELNQLKFHISRCKVDISADQEKVCVHHLKAKRKIYTYIIMLKQLSFNRKVQN